MYSINFIVLCSQHHDHMKHKVTSNKKIILQLVFNRYFNLKKKKINFYDSYRSRWVLSPNEEI